MKEELYLKLVKAFQSDDVKIISKIYDIYSDALYGIIVRIIPDEEYAKDVLQESFVKIWNNRMKYDSSKGRLFTWMARIARNSALNMKESKSYRNSLKIQTDENLVFINKDFSRRDLIDMKGIVGRLPEKYKEVIYYCYFKGFTQKEASDELDIPIGTIKTRIKAALKELRRVYEYERKEVLVMILLIWIMI